MRNHPTLDKLRTLKLAGMLTAFQAQHQRGDCDDLSFEERLGLLPVYCEITERDARKLQSRPRLAKLRHAACVEDIDYRSRRGLDKAQLRELSQCRWVHEALNLPILDDWGLHKLNTQARHDLLELHEDRHGRRS